MSDMKNPAELNFGELAGVGVKIETLDSTLNGKHIPTDRYRWSDFYGTQLDLYEQIAASQALKPDFDNMVNVPQGTPYVVNAPQGGLLTVNALNNSGFFTVVEILGKDGWNSDGLIEGVSITKYFRLLNGDQIQVDNASSVTFTPAIEDESNTTRIALQGLEDSMAENKKSIMDIKASLSNKKPSGTMTDIESAAQGDGFIVPANNSMGGRIHGKGINALLGSTGVVNVANAEGTIEVYNNLGLLSLLAPVPILVEDVMDGDVVTSTGMSELFYEPYIAGTLE